METDLKLKNYAYITGEPPVATAPVSPPTMLVLNTKAMPLLGREPQRMSCPSCHNTMQTRLERRPNKNTHLIALILCITGLVCLAPLPYCLKSCRSLDHYCSCCNQYLGKAVN